MTQQQHADHDYIRFLRLFIQKMYSTIVSWMYYLMRTIIQKLSVKVATADTAEDFVSDNDTLFLKTIITKEKDDSRNLTFNDTTNRSFNDESFKWDDILNILFPYSSSSSSSSTSSKSNGGIITLLPNHIEQMYYWDCGITCLEMIFTWLLCTHNKTEELQQQQVEQQDDDIMTTNQCDNDNVLLLREWMIRTISTESIWTIDLIYVLHRFSQKYYKNSIYSKFTYVMITKSSLLLQQQHHHRDDDKNNNNDDDKKEDEKNMNNNNLGDANYYVHLPYYKDTFVQDRDRIQQRLQQMQHEGKNEDHKVQINNNCHIYQLPNSSGGTKSILSMDQIIYCIQHENCVAIALVDNIIFTTTTPTFSTTVTTNTANSTHVQSKQDCSITTSCHLNRTTYVGHYIIIVGISYDTEHIHAASLRMKSVPDDNDNDDPVSSTQKNEITDHNKPTNRECCLVIYNPARSTGCGSSSISNENPTVPAPEYVTITHFEHAWRAHGTDDDIIIIARQ